MLVMLLLLLILLMVGGMPVWPYSVSWGWGPTGLFAVVATLALVLILVEILRRPDGP